MSGGWQGNGGWGAQAPAGGEEVPWGWALARAWAAGILTLAVTEYLQITLVDLIVGNSTDSLESVPSQLFAIHLPNLICVALAVAASSLVHAEPHRYSAGRHAVALLAVPLAVQLLVVTTRWEDQSVQELLVAVAVLSAGCAAGWTLGRLRGD
ncbi:hypothetical protein [Streptomyces sp. NPDC050504]|uniref:hypothetical protein n=1 Tax=Streptomyces sp. NPDC050504 TaxID=3365618 RepID=UPI0037AFBE6C